jgi:hypothetical protein
MLLNLMFLPILSFCIDFNEHIFMNIHTSILLDGNMKTVRTMIPFLQPVNGVRLADQKVVLNVPSANQSKPAAQVLEVACG